MNTFWSEKSDTVLERLSVKAGEGLSSAEIARRRRRYGPNSIVRKKRKSVWLILWNQFENVIVLLLAAAALATFLVGRWMEGVAIGVVVVCNALIGFVTELRAVRSMEALAKLSQSTTTVRREGRLKTIPSWQLVPGDIVVFEAGDTVSADLRLLEAARVETDESTLTGESQPVAKNSAMVDRDAPLAERSCMFFNGTSVTRGSGEAVVVATGMDTELGRISTAIQQVEQERTPLEGRLDDLGRAFVRLTAVLSVIVIATGWIMGKKLLLVVENGIALAVAAIPEGMPIVATIALARGMRRMARRNAIINRLSSVETLGGATIIATDKTGTLTENQMTVTRLVMPGMDVLISGEGLEREGRFSIDGRDIDPSDNERLRTILLVGALCGNADLVEDDGGVEAVGDPMEAALMVAAAKGGMSKRDILAENPEVAETPFDPEEKMMATVHRTSDGCLYAVKGAPEEVLHVCRSEIGEDGRQALDEDSRQKWLERSNSLAAEGLRILALAMKKEPGCDTVPYSDLHFLGLACFLDPPRETIKEAIAAAHRAGIRTIMVTGDQVATARTVAEQLKMAEAPLEAMEGSELDIREQMSEEQRSRILQSTIFARVTPQQKLDLITLYQQEGHVVAMTGDGVNDAPALEKADIGVAMGRRGTQVAREAADMILKDDSFSTMVAAIEEGRIIFRNIRQFILYLLTISLSMILVVFFGSILNMPMPLLPLQILYLNAVTHVFPALALGMGERHSDIMAQPPRDPDLPILQRRDWQFIALQALVISVVALGGLYYVSQYQKMDEPRSQTVCFLIVTFGQMLHVFQVRREGSGILVNEVTGNVYIWLAVLLSIVLSLAMLYVVPLSSVMRLVAPGAVEWAVVLGFCLVILLIGQLLLVVREKITYQTHRDQKG